MTKVRPPLSINQALDRIAGHLPGGWVEMAALTTRAERTVRNWGDPDTPDNIPMDCAVSLDLAYQRAGGVGAPIHDVYALLLETGRERVFACQAEIAQATILGVEENSEALQAQIACTLPGSDDSAVDHAIGETEEAIAAHTRTLTLLRRRKEGALPP